MKPTLALTGLTTAALLVLSAIHGYGTAYSVAYGAVVAEALAISATFFWLWRTRATPLALGMGFSWAGAFGVMGWWWLYQRLGAPEIMVENPILFLFVATYFIGGVLHFNVIIRSLGAKSVIVLLPAVLVVAGAYLF